jgi:hypothetical protein
MEQMMESLLTEMEAEIRTNQDNMASKLKDVKTQIGCLTSQMDVFEETLDKVGAWLEVAKEKGRRLGEKRLKPSKRN